MARKNYVIAATKAGDPNPAQMSDKSLFLSTLAGFAFAGPLPGLLAALVYGWVPSPSFYLGLAVGLAVLMTVAAVSSHTPMTVEKVVLNFSVALTFGLLLPRLAGG